MHKSKYIYFSARINTREFLYSEKKPPAYIYMYIDMHVIINEKHKQISFISEINGRC